MPVTPNTYGGPLQGVGAYTCVRCEQRPEYYMAWVVVFRCATTGTEYTFLAPPAKDDGTGGGPGYVPGAVYELEARGRAV